VEGKKYLRAAEEEIRRRSKSGNASYHTVQNLGDFLQFKEVSSSLG
jgi:hypothetical protein